MAARYRQVVDGSGDFGNCKRNECDPRIEKFCAGPSVEFQSYGALQQFNHLILERFLLMA